MKQLYYLMIGLLVLASPITYSQKESPNVNVKDLSLKATLTDSIRYYYYPNLEAYYDLHETVYIYKIDGKWKSTKYLSPNYRGYSIYNKHFEIIKGLVTDDPTVMYEIHKKKYLQYHSCREMKLQKMKQEKNALTLN